MRTLVLVSLLVVSASVCKAQNVKEQRFRSAITEVIKAFSTQDSTRLSKFIKKDIGVYLLHRFGILDTYTRYKTIGFTSQEYPAVILNYAKGIQIKPLVYAKLPVFSCATERWNKYGLFTDTTKIDHLPSKSCITYNEHNPNSFSAKEIKTLRDLENKSRRVVLTDKSNKDLVFYLTYINNNWYFTILDMVTSDCSV